ncbi:protein C19orf12 homolog [Oratosquilla oratoria]|uniref:protein C19orf12 homolog n=1 Tax=Oratosquilla oratoria TaxID=337810 RepID=UPI003F76F9EC
MPINTIEIIDLLAELSEEENLRVTVKESVKGGLIAGATTVLGGMLLGPVGLAVGGTFGGITAAILSQDKFRSVASVLRDDLTHTQKQRLASSAMKIVNSLDATDIYHLMSLLTMFTNVRYRLITETINFLSENLKMHVID